MKYPTISLRFLVMLACSFSAWAARPSGAGESKPNVLFIAVDDMRCDLQCYGNSQILSPNIDALADRGTLFTRAYCQQAVCNPSRASLLTGMRPSTLRIWDLPTHFRKRVPNVVTLPQHFKNNGYRALGYGKIFHNWRQDEYKGDRASWSQAQVLHYNSHGNDKALVFAGETALSPKQLDSTFPDLSTTPRTEIRDVPDDAYFDGRIAKLAVDEIERLSRQDQPFFLGVGFWKPHAHFNAPKKYWDMYDRESISAPTNPTPPKNVPSIALHDSREILRGFKKHPGGKPSAADVITLRHGYYAAITYVDAQIGKVLDALDRHGLRDNTLVVLWSDHGFHLGEHGLWAKTSNFELDARVPLIIARPGSKKGEGIKQNQIVELLDLYPTIVSQCGLPRPKHLKGFDRSDALDNVDSDAPNQAITWHPRPAYPAEGKNPDAMGWSIRTDRFRYTQWLDFDSGKRIADELYDHENDPNETINVAGDNKFQSTVGDHRARLKAYVDRFHAD